MMRVCVTCGYRPVRLSGGRYCVICRNTVRHAIGKGLERNDAEDVAREKHALDEHGAAFARAFGGVWIPPVR